jgi:hypothetical protein
MSRETFTLEIIASRGIISNMCERGLKELQGAYATPSSSEPRLP